MTLADALAQKVSQLPVDQQMQVLDFVEFLQQRQARRGPRRDPEGLLADQPSGLTYEDFVQARREMWRNAPREFPR